MGRPAHPARAMAIEAGETTYFTGQPCCLGMIAYRTVKENKCQCELHRSMKAKNAKSRYERDRAERIAKAACWAASNKKSRRKASRDWASRNSHKVKANTHKRRAIKKNATPAWFGELDEMVVVEAHDLAKQRELETGIKWEVDHIIPLAGRKVSGLHVASNIQVIPMTLNRKKSNRYAVQ